MNSMIVVCHDEEKFQIIHSGFDIHLLIIGQNNISFICRFIQLRYPNSLRKVKIGQLGLLYVHTSNPTAI